MEKKKLTANQIHKKYVGDKVSFKEWITTEKALYLAKDKKSDLSMDDWLHNKYAVLKDNFLSANFKETWASAKDWLTDHKDDIIDTAGQIVDATSNDGDAEQEPPKPESKKILGMPRGIFIAGAVLVAVGVGIGVYSIVKHKKSK